MTAVLLAGLLGAVNPVVANAAGTVLFQNSFANRTVDGTGTVTVPTPTSGTNAVCLTASGNTATLPVLSCAGASDAQGSGKLRLTPSGTNQVGGVFGATSFPTSNGLDLTFTSYQWGGGAADGIAFMLGAVDPANPAAPAIIGPPAVRSGTPPPGRSRVCPTPTWASGSTCSATSAATPSPAAAAPIRRPSPRRSPVPWSCAAPATARWATAASPRRGTAPAGPGCPCAPRPVRPPPCRCRCCSLDRDVQDARRRLLRIVDVEPALPHRRREAAPVHPLREHAGNVADATHIRTSDDMGMQPETDPGARLDLEPRTTIGRGDQLRPRRLEGEIDLPAQVAHAVDQSHPPAVHHVEYVVQVEKTIAPVPAYSPHGPSLVTTALRGKPVPTRPA